MIVLKGLDHSPSSSPTAVHGVNPVLYTSPALDWTLSLQVELRSDPWASPARSPKTIIFFFFFF